MRPTVGGQGTHRGPVGRGRHRQAKPFTPGESRDWRKGEDGGLTHRASFTERPSEQIRFLRVVAQALIRVSTDPNHRPREPIDARGQCPCLLVTGGHRYSLPQNLFGHGTKRLGVSFAEGLVHLAIGGPKRLLGLQLAGSAGTPRRVIEGFDCAPVRALMSGQTDTHGLIGQRVDPIQVMAEEGLGSLGWIKVRRGSHFEVLQAKEKADGPGCKVSGFSG
jgi:hypothetical protein